jgi:hypothetical protein
MPTSTPPPYFPQGTLSPGDEKTRRKMKWTLYGCLAFLVGVLVGVVVGLVYLVRSWGWF